MRVEASSMLMISSATRNSVSRSRARAMSRRWSWPPLSWCGYLWSTWPGVEVDGLQRGRHAFAPPRRPRRRSRKKTPRRIEKTWSTLKIGLHELKGSWKTPWTRAVVVAQGRALERRRCRCRGDVMRPAVDGDQAQDHPPDGGLAAAALADQRDDLAAVDLEADVADGPERAAAEGADPVRSCRRAVERQHQAAFQQATAWPGADLAERAAPPRTPRRRAGSGRGSGSRPAG